MNELTLYETLEIERQITALAEAQDGELTDDQLKQLVEAQTTSMVKLGNLCKFMRQLDLAAEMADAEIWRIAEMKERAVSRLASIKKFLTPYVKDKGKVTVGTFTLSVRKSESVAVEEYFCDKEFMRIIPASEEPDKKKIKEALKSGVKLMGASLITKDNLQIK